ncbi:deoxyribodipyrimidine photo-lyase [Bosea sp. (in: a-proteobacteria)]|uniref:cryptochrome/photolyase family protein n=1 Tax=Bosea sp. (in: a-proteobacteria) TaxID=1871050 RepID=UPI002DDDB610|nr:deoxyribodipyrimidine photo-lyase [Bosea sp. (in: a-proteobacteria)]HEV2510020.1 deoxyribodipyrimidine photo-lyase [Bosea sp. (in: a-proteobacteria)]
MTSRPALFWFRDDLRLSDNPALRAASERGPLICLYILDTSTQRRPLGGAARWWLSRSLTALSNAIAAKGGELLLLRGDPAELLPHIVREAHVGYVAWNRRYDGTAITLDKAVKATLTEAGVTVESFNANLLNEPWQVKTKAGGPFKVFTPYWRAVRERDEPSAPLPAPARLSKARLPAALREQALTVADLALEPTKPDWAGGLREAWTPGEDGARDRLDAFLDETIAGYREARDQPDRISTSRLSPHLRFGEISPRQIWHATQAAREAGNTPGSAADVEKFFSEIGWREFSYHLLFHNPELASVNYDRRFDAMSWEKDETGLTAWQKGLTGYPIVDAGLRELWQTGWMHNRVRMITASFLIKHLLTDWRAGETWFWDTLVDADPANNPASWQWVAGSGADAAPYFRVFNPVTQGEKFDPKGAYVRRFVPELAELGDKFIHRPWDAPANELKQAGIVLGRDYPKPIVALDLGRRRALDAFAALRSE